MIDLFQIERLQIHLDLNICYNQKKIIVYTQIFNNNNKALAMNNNNSNNNYNRHKKFKVMIIKVL